MAIGKRLCVDLEMCLYCAVAGHAVESVTVSVDDAVALGTENASGVVREAEIVTETGTGTGVETEIGTEEERGTETGTEEGRKSNGIAILINFVCTRCMAHVYGTSDHGFES